MIAPHPPAPPGAAPAGNPWTDARLDEMRRVGDPLGQRAMDALFQAGEVAAVSELLTQLVRNDEIPMGPWPAAMEAYLRASQTLPAAPNETLIARGEGVFFRFGLTSFSILACASLPECYVLGDVAAVLGHTQRLREHARRRIFETAWMVLAVMEAGGLGPTGTGVRVVQKVRLMHATIRHLIQRPPELTLPAYTLADALLAQQWPSERGEPISQEDLVAVHLTFSHVILRGWRDLGIELPPEDEEAYLYCWNVVGHLMGIQEEFLPKTVEDARALFEAIKRRRARDTADGRILTAALVTFCEGIVPWPRFFTRPIVRILMRGLLDPTTSEMLGVPKLRLWHRVYRQVLKAVVFTVNALKRDLFLAFPGVGGLSAMLSRHWLESFLTQSRGGERATFQIPATLATRWRVAPRSSPPASRS